MPELTAAIDRAFRAERDARWRWTPSAALRNGLDACSGAADELARAARYGANLSSADDAVALWALTCIDSGEHDGDELHGMPPELRAAVATIVIRRVLDDEAVLARWAWLDREIPKLGHGAPDRSADRAHRSRAAPPRDRVRGVRSQ